MKRFISIALFPILLILPMLSCEALTPLQPTQTPPPSPMPIATSTIPPEPTQTTPEPGYIVIFEDTLAAGQSADFPVLAMGDNSISAEVAPTGNLDLRIEVQNIDKNVLQVVNDAGPGGKELITYAFPPDASLDVYYIVVFAESGKASYKAAWTGTLGVTFEMHPRYVVATYMEENGYSMYAVTVESGDTLQANANPVEGEMIDPILQVIKLTDVNTILAEYNTVGPGEQEKITYTFPESGVYFIQVKDAGNKGGRFVFEADLE